MTDALLGGAMMVAYVISPGPVNVETLRRGWLGGFWAAFSVQLGALLGDGLYALLAWLGIALVMQHPIAQMGLGIGGAGFLGYLGVVALHHAWHEPHEAPLVVLNHHQHQHHFWVGVAMALANPYGLLFWMAVNQAILQHPEHQGIAFLGGFFGFGLLAAWLLAAGVQRSRRFVSSRGGRLASAVFGLLLVGGGLNLGWRTIAGMP